MFRANKIIRKITLVIGFNKNKKGAVNLLITYPVVILFSFYLSNFLFDYPILRWE